MVAAAFNKLLDGRGGGGGGDVGDAGGGGVLNQAAAAAEPGGFRSLRDELPPHY